MSNEFGQILISVLTAHEGPGLDLMAADVIKRFSKAEVEPPIAMYVDCGCCVGVGESKLQTRFTGWPNLYIRLDIWHFMRRLAAGCTTDSHQLYGTFMSRLSACIFEWDAKDVSLLRQAKRAQLEQDGMPLLSNADIRKYITKAELALHCRRRTRAPEITCQAIEDLIHELDGHKGRDSLGVPLLDSVNMANIWKIQKRHLTCIQDPPNMMLYTETGTIKKGQVSLKTYRCARGSTSLESFHLHLNRFIPGMYF